MDNVEVLPFTDAAAREAGGVRANLHDAGTLIRAYDILTAGHVLATGCTLITNNTRDFSRIADLPTENWATNPDLSPGKRP